MFNWSSRRRELAEQAAQRELADDAARNASWARCTPSSQDLAGLFRDDLPTVTGPRVVTGIGPKGGSEKATTRGLRRPGPDLTAAAGVDPATTARRLMAGLTAW